MIKPLTEKQKGGLLIGVIILIGLIAQIYNSQIQQTTKKYTIGTIDKIFSTANMEVHAGYSYDISGKTYTNSINRFGHVNVAKVGAQFIVSVPLGHLDHGVIMFDKPVSENLDVPKDGWSEIPTAY